MKNEMPAEHAAVAEPGGSGDPSSGKPAWPKVSDHSKKIETGVTMKEGQHRRRGVARAV
jgi:hypothetical protein